MDNRLPLIQEADLKGKIVLVRVDHNVVKSGVIHDPYRIDATFGTLFYILSKGGKIILMTHVGRPRDKKTGKITLVSLISLFRIRMETKLVKVKRRRAAVVSTV